MLALKHGAEGKSDLKTLQIENHELKDKIQKLMQERKKNPAESLTNEVAELKQKFKESEFSFQRFKDDLKLFMFYTGF